jgi:hemolysin III
MQATEKFNSISHLIGATLALIGGTWLITLAAKTGDARATLSVSLYALTLLLLYLISSLYHSLSGRKKQISRVLDHQAIYLLIAGTYTPFTLVGFKGTLGWWMFGTIWALAVLGILIDALPQRGPRVIAMLIYLLMGWLCVFALQSLLATLPPEAFRWLLVGGILYTSGILFYLLDHRYPACHGIWHLFVLAGSISHYGAIMFLL